MHVCFYFFSEEHRKVRDIIEAKNSNPHPTPAKQTNKKQILEKVIKRLSQAK